MRLIGLLFFLSTTTTFYCWAQAQQEAQSRCTTDDDDQQQTTPSDALGPFYIPNSPITSNMAPQALLANPLERLEVSGRVLSSRRTNYCEVGIANVTVEVWYAGNDDNDGQGSGGAAAVGYHDDKFRGQVTTDACGRYSFVQTFPALYVSRPILHSHFRLSSSNNDGDEQELLVTQMYFEGSTDGYVNYQDHRKLQVVQVSTNTDGVRSVEFNMYVDLEGDADASCDGGAGTTDQQEETDDTDGDDSNNEMNNNDGTTVVGSSATSMATSDATTTIPVFLLSVVVCLHFSTMVL